MQSRSYQPLALSIAIASHCPPPLAAPAHGAELYEEIVVTAQKREQRLIDVPMGITALSGEAIEQRGISNIQDLSFAVPGMTMREDGPGSYTIFMRGLANTDSDGALVGVYLDDSSLTMTGYDQLDMRPIDLERVEVLKGPQGTLYGQGSIAGTVRFISKKPVTDAFEGSIGASYAAVDGGDTKETITGIVNLPVIEDVLALRLAGTVEQGGGWQDQPEAGIEDGNYQDLSHWRLSALWQINERLQAQARVITHRNQSRLGLGYEEEDRSVAVAIDPGLELVPKKYDYDLYSLTLSYDMGFAQLLSISTYIDHDHQYPFTYFGTEQTIYAGTLEGNDARFLDADQFSQEIRLVSSGEGPWQWTLGGFYQDLQRDFFARFDTLFEGTLFADAEFIADTTIEARALFAEVTYSLTERLEIGAGARHYEDDLSTWDGELLEKDSFDSTDPRLFATYALSEQANLYVNIAKGFRTGGFNRGDLPNYEPESVINYEIGAKAALLDGGLSLELAAYFTEYDDMLRRGLVFVEPAFVSLTSNIGNVEVSGFEAALSWRATDALTLTASGAWIDSEVTAIRSDDATNIVGDATDYVPDLSYSLGAQYRFDWADNMPGFLRLDYNYRDRVSYIDRSSFPAQNLPQWSEDIALLDARIGLSWKRLRVELFGTNLANEDKYIDPYIGWKNANRTRPRTLGVQANYDF